MKFPLSLQKRTVPALSLRPRLVLQYERRPHYVIGDVHGAISLLRKLEEAVVTDSARFSERPKIVMLGDFIDRGPHSAQVIDHLLTINPHFDRICLAGNHELVCADYLAGRVPFNVWERHGAANTLLSFGIDPEDWLGALKGGLREAAREAFGRKRISFLDTLPVLLRIGDVVMVHAGLRPGVALEDQSDTDITTIRDEFFDHSNTLPYWVVHGHTPVSTPTITDQRINIDTQAWRTGRLTALRLFSRDNGFIQT